MRIALCVLLALLATGCQSVLPSVGGPLISSSDGIVSVTNEVTPTAVAYTNATATVTATPSPSVTPTVVPSPTATVAPTWPKGAPELVRGDTSQPYVALTLDAGAGAQFTPSILDILREKKLQTTIFLTGKWAEENPSLVQQMLADGHELGNHSYDHPDFTTLKPAAIIDQVNRTDEIVRKVTGTSTRPMFRYPFGARDAQTNAVLADLGYRSIFWTLDSTDWREETTPEMELNRVMKYTEGGDIVVFHLNAEPTSKCLGQIIDQLRAKGFKLVKLTQLPT